MPSHTKSERAKKLSARLGFKPGPNFLQIRGGPRGGIKPRAKRGRGPVASPTVPLPKRSLKKARLLNSKAKRGKPVTIGGRKAFVKTRVGRPTPKLLNPPKTRQATPRGKPVTIGGRKAFVKTGVGPAVRPRVRTTGPSLGGLGRTPRRGTRTASIGNLARVKTRRR